jgi:hypothetical protein
MVEFISYNGQELPFVYDYYVITRLKKISKEVSEEELFENILFYGIERGCWEMDREFTINKGDKVLAITPKICAYIIGSIGIEKVNELLITFSGQEKDDGKKKLK